MDTSLPTLETKRLILRPFNIDDASEVQKLAGDREIAKTTLNIPYPYEDGMAEEWINTHQEAFKKGKIFTLAIVHKQENYLIGAIGLTINKEFEHGEIGYWIGKPYWGKGYCTEATNDVLNYGFNKLELNRIFARHMKNNPASGRVMQKVGMKLEGTLKQHVKKWGEFQDILYYGILKDEKK